MPRENRPNLPNPEAGIRKVAQEQLGFEDLRPGQREAVIAVLEGHDTLAVQPTGSGKSAIYQIAGLDGEFIFQIGEEKFRAKPGTTVFGPRGVPYSFLSVSNTVGRTIIGFQPAGRMEEFFVEFASIDHSVLTAPRLDSRLYGMEIVGPRVRADGVK